MDVALFIFTQGEEAVTVSVTCITVAIPEGISHRLRAGKAPLKYLVAAISAYSEIISPLSVIYISPFTPQDKGFV